MNNFDLRNFLYNNPLFEEEKKYKIQFTNQTSFPKDSETAEEAYNQLISLDPNAPLFKSMEYTEKSKDGEETVKKPDVKKAKEWAEKLGKDELIKRINAVGNKIPSSGLAKKDMPFLPGPKDAKGTVDDVEDALTPGGKYNVDFKEAVTPPSPNTFLGMDDQKAKDFMDSGNKDGDDKDDKAEFKKDPQIAASSAIPTQTNILLPKALGMAINGVSGGKLGAYFSSKGEILDGHHRWAATMLNNPSAQIGGFASIDLDAMGGKEKALKYLTTIGNALGNKTKIKENQLKVYNKKSLIKSIIREEILKMKKSELKQLIKEEQLEG